MGASDLQTRLFVLLRKICFSNAVLFSSNENPTRRVSSRRLDGARLPILIPHDHLSLIRSVYVGQCYRNLAWEDRENLMTSSVQLQENIFFSVLLNLENDP